MLFRTMILCLAVGGAFLGAKINAPLPYFYVLIIGVFIIGVVRARWKKNNEKVDSE